MAIRYFTVEEANHIVNEIKPLMGELLERRAKAVRISRQIKDLLAAEHVDFGGPLPSTLFQEFYAIEMLLKRIKSYGCVVKSLEAGLVDFLAQIDGRDVYLCWRYSEERVAYYHELHTGFQGRKTLF